ncbi:MAG: response regulator [Myxococcales bacterium]|nr:response regulator [Myxococcales bacterium]
MTNAASHSLLGQYGIGNLLFGTVVVVDDEPMNTEVLRSFLESDYRVLEAQSGVAALALIQAESVDVVLTDQRMPGMTGVELLERLRELRPDVVGIVVTGYSDPPALIAAINRARAFRLIKKPWQPHEVLEAVVRASSDVQSARAIRQLIEQLHARSTELQHAVNDLTAAQEQLVHMERVAMTGRLASGIAHDLRNAMSGLLLLEEELRRRAAAPDLVEVAHIGLKGVRNLLESLESMNQYARNQQLKLAATPFDPALAVHDAVGMLRLDLAFRQRAVSVHAPAGTLPDVAGDRQKIVQVLVNLLRNAAQATRSGDAIRVEVHRDGAWAAYTVDDAGRGVSESVRANLFQAFVSTKGDGGIGMGLYMAQLIVASHGGHIEVGESVLGGAQFRVAVPLLQVD